MSNRAGPQFGTRLGGEADFSYFRWYKAGHGPIAQLDRVTDFYSVGCRFESCWDRQSDPWEKPNRYGLFAFRDATRHNAIDRTQGDQRGRKGTQNPKKSRKKSRTDFTMRNRDRVCIPRIA